MTTLLQAYIGIGELLVSQPELANYEIHVVDETGMKDVGETVKGKCLCYTTDDDLKLFDLSVNVPEENLTGMSAEVDKLANVSEQEALFRVLRNNTLNNKQLKKYFEQLVVRVASGEIYHKFRVNGDNDHVTCTNVKTGEKYGFTPYGLFIHLADGTAEVL